MSNLWNKLDGGLQKIYSNFLDIRQQGRSNVGWIHPVLRSNRTGLYISLQYNGELADIEHIGFTTNHIEREGLAQGYIKLEDVEALTSHDNVVRLSFGEERYPALDESTIDIFARKPLAGPRAFLWQVDRSTGVFSGNTGEDVIIGFIDSGIDFKHKVFHKNDSPETRILRIWDQGLDKVAGEEPPKASLISDPESLFVSQTYGVEYTNEQIDKFLQKKPGALNIRHKDCGAHGTHVAAIAAGDGRQPAFLTLDGYDYVGVAPKASIIMVKAVFLPDDSEGNGINWNKRIIDAMRYIINVANSYSKPVVINASISSRMGPHDGLEELDVLVNDLFKGEKGKACVLAAGNDAGPRPDKEPKRQHAIIKIPTGGEIEIPFYLNDTRHFTKDKNHCEERSNTIDLEVQLWYKDIDPKKVKVSLKLPPPYNTVFTPAVNLGDAPIKNNYDGKKTYELSHETVVSEESPVTGKKVKRNKISLTITPDEDAHKSGVYILKVEGEPTTELHAWCQGWGLQIIGIAQPSVAPLSANIIVTDDNTIAGMQCAPNVITVASYNLHGDIAEDSSRGPVVDYSGDGPISVKPDVAAPGVLITSAKSTVADLKDLLYLIKSMIGDFYIKHSGTSMAAPHVAGVIALLLQKDKTLSAIDILKRLQENARPDFPANAFGTGRIDAQRTVDDPN